MDFVRHYFFPLFFARIIIKGSPQNGFFSFLKKILCFQNKVVSDLPLFPIIVSQHEVELLISGPLVEGNDVGQHVDVAQPLPEDAEQGVLGDVVDHVQGAGGTQVPLPANRGISSPITLF